MAVNPAQLAFQTQQAYSRGTEVDTQPLVDGAIEKRDFERAEYKSLQDVGSELDANFYGKWENNLNTLYEKASTGELKVGSPEWSAATKKLKDRAAQIKQVQDLRDEQIQLFQTKPDQTQFLEETETGELIDTGGAGYRERIEELLQNDYDDPIQLANDFATLSRRVQIMPVGISTGFKEARTSTEKVGETLLNAGETEVQNQQVRAGNITFDVKTTMNLQDTDRMVKGLVSQYEPVLRADYKRKSAVQDLGLTENEYVKTTIESMLPSGKVENTTRSVPQSRARGGGATKTEIERARNVKPAVREAIDTKDPAKILEYVSPFGYRGELTPEGKFRFYTIDQQSSGTKAKNIKEIDLNEESLYDFIADVNDDVSRAAIDTFESPSTNPENLPKGEQRLTEIKINKQIKEAETEIDGVFENWDKSSGTKKQLVEGLVKNFNLSGVSFKDPAIGFDKIVIDGQEYDEEDIVTIKELISAKIKGGETTGSGIGAKYNTK